MWTAFWIMMVATLAGCLVSTLHYALRDFSLVKLREIVERRGGQRSVDAVLEDVDGHALAAGALRVVANVAITVCAVLLFEVVHAGAAAAAAPEVAPGVAVSLWRLVGASITATGLIYFFALVIPMSLAEHAGERLIQAFAGPLRLMHVLAWPVRALSFVDVAVKRLAGVAHMSEAQQLHEEIISVVTEGEREGNLGEAERRMIEAIVEFKSRTVEEVMTPRTEIEGFELTDDMAFIKKFIQEGGHSRIPVYLGGLDHIAGILYAKDLLKYVGADTSGFKLRPLLRRPVWVPETKPLTELLYELRARKVHIAIVLDEYGGTTGLVTFEDLLEEIVGEIQDEYEPLHETLPEIEVSEEEHAAEMEARAYIDDANAALRAIGVQLPEGEEYDTVGGYVLAALGHIPVAGESFEQDGFVVTVLEAEPTRVTRLRIEARPTGDQPGASAEEGNADGALAPGDPRPGGLAGAR